MHGHVPQSQRTLMQATVAHLMVAMGPNAHSENRVVFHKEENVTPLNAPSPAQIIQVVTSIAQLYVVGLKEPHASQIDRINHTVGCCHGDRWQYRGTPDERTPS